MKNIHPVIFYTDAALFILFLVMIVFIIWISRHKHLRLPWHQVAHNRLGMIAVVILLGYIGIGLLDSLHFRDISTGMQTKSVLDVLVSPIAQTSEKTYSAPFAIHAYVKELVILKDGQTFYAYPHLNYVSEKINTLAQRNHDVFNKSLVALIQAMCIWFFTTILLILLLAKKAQVSFLQQMKKITLGQTWVPWREMIITIGLIILLTCWTFKLAQSYHILGTDKVGQDIFYEVLKSIRTGLVIGTVTTLIVLPFAIFCGTYAGYFGGWLDDLIQYVYTTLSSVPAVLLISAAVLSLQVFINNHIEFFPSLAVRADMRLFALCVILGVTGWTYLCRVLRGETLKLREIDFVQAALALGAKNHKIITRHILPNIMHIILITVVIDFSGLVLSEAVLSYVGVGVDPTTFSWGNMINSARLELAREPVVWWPLVSAFASMFMLVLAANIFADAVRDAFDPRSKIF
jgi:peptide/nickel transport system permease protein